MRIVSNNICYGPMPEPNEEVEQHLSINNEGRVWFSGYNFGLGGERYEKARSKNFKIEKVATDKLFVAIAAYFGNEYTEIFATDIGDWVMELTNTEGITYKFRGSLCADTRAVPLRAATIKMVCRRISQILRKRCLTSFVSMVWEKFLTHQFMAK